MCRLDRPSGALLLLLYRAMFLRYEMFSLWSYMMVGFMCVELWSCVTPAYACAPCVKLACLA